MNDFNSKRQYEIQMIEGGGEFSQRKINLFRLLNLKKNEWEYIYALHEILDKVLDLKDGQSMYFQPCRDNDDSKGIILRIL